MTNPTPPAPPSEVAARLRSKIGRFSNGPLMDEAADMIEQQAAAIAAMQPEGWVLVPRDDLSFLAALHNRNVYETNGEDKVKWEGVWYNGPLATAYLKTLREISKLAQKMLATAPIAAATSGKEEDNA